MSTFLVNGTTGSEFLEYTNLGRNSYADRRYEPQTQNNFTFQFLFDELQVAYLVYKYNKYIAPTALGSEKMNSNIGHYSENLEKINEILNHTITQINSPTKSVGQIVIDFFNSQIKYAGKPTYSNANITLNNLIGLSSKNLLSAWSELCLDDVTNKGGWARSSSLEKNTVARNFLDNEWYKRNTDSDRDALASQLLRYAGYKVDGLLLECARDGTIVNSWLYVGMWLSDFTPGSYSMSGSSSPSQVTATITVDQITQAADDFKILTKSTAISGLGYTILPQDSTTL